MVAAAALDLGSGGVLCGGAAALRDSRSSGADVSDSLILTLAASSSSSSSSSSSCEQVLFVLAVIVLAVADDDVEAEVHDTEAPLETFGGDALLLALAARVIAFLLPLLPLPRFVSIFRAPLACCGACAAPALPNAAPSLLCGEEAAALFVKRLKPAAARMRFPDSDDARRRPGDDETVPTSVPLASAPAAAAAAAVSHEAGGSLSELGAAAFGGAAFVGAADCADCASLRGPRIPLDCEVSDDGGRGGCPLAPTLARSLDAGSSVCDEDGVCAATSLKLPPSTVAVVVVATGDEAAAPLPLPPPAAAAALAPAAAVAALAACLLRTRRR